jgi:orotidine-5'-phosphate decarboxylase
MTKGKTMTKNPILCAIDSTDVAKAKALGGQLAGSVGALKLGLEFFVANGAAGVREVAAGGLPIFLDLKFHDIPNTVAGAVRSAAGMDVFMLTIHAAGGKAMMQAAMEAASAHKKKPLVVAVTILTSMDQNDVHSIGVQSSVADQVKRLADLAQQSGVDGVVCSPQEIEILRAHCGKNFKLVVPGIRPAGSDAGDQKRIMTPPEALALGADYLVIGTPITGAANPKKAAKVISASCGVHTA